MLNVVGASGAQVASSYASYPGPASGDRATGNREIPSDGNGPGNVSTRWSLGRSSSLSRVQEDKAKNED